MPRKISFKIPSAFILKNILNTHIHFPSGISSIHFYSHQHNPKKTRLKPSKIFLKMPLKNERSTFIAFQTVSFKLNYILHKYPSKSSFIALKKNVRKIPERYSPLKIYLNLVYSPQNIFFKMSLKNVL